MVINAGSKRRQLRLRWQLYPSYLLITLCALVVVGYLSSQLIKDTYYRTTEKDLRGRAYLLSALQTKLENGEGRNSLQSVSHDPKLRITLIDNNGEILSDTFEDPRLMVNHYNRPEIVTARNLGEGSAIRYSQTLDMEMMYVAVRREGDKGYLRAAYPLRLITEDLRKLYAQMFMAGAVIAALAGLISWLVGKRFSRPLEELEEKAINFARGNLEERANIYSTRELTSLALTMNQMAGEIQARINGVLEQRNEYRAVLDSMKEGVLAVDETDRILTLNQAAADLFHLDPERVSGKFLPSYIHNAQVLALLSDARGADEAVESEIVDFLAPRQIVEAHAFRLRDGKGQVFGVLAVFHNITRIRELENIRTDFVANVSHELKTPITAIQGFVETLLDGAWKEPEDAKRFLKIVGKHTSRLSSIIDDLLNLSKLESEGREVEREPMNLVDLCRTAISTIEEAAKDKQIQLQLELDGDLPVLANASLLAHAISNLVDNAVKYSPAKSTIYVRVSQDKQAALVEVVDFGSGIGEEHLPRLFERFYRVDKARSNKVGGTGLGLAIVKHIVQIHEGRVDVESELGQGSTFRITLPLLAG